MALTGDFRSAVILNQLICWTAQDYNFNELLKEDDTHQHERHLIFQHGWIIKSAQELIEETMLGLSRQTMRILLKSLVKAGWLRELIFEENKRHKTIKYRLNLLKLHQDLQARGYTLNNFLFSSTPQNSQTLSSQHRYVKNLTHLNKKEDDVGSSVTAITLPVTVQHSHVLNSQHIYVKNLTHLNKKGDNVDSSVTAMTPLLTPRHSHVLSSHHGYVKNLTHFNKKEDDVSASVTEITPPLIPQHSHVLSSHHECVKNLTYLNKKRGDTGASVTEITLPVTMQHSYVLNSHHGYVKNLTHLNKKRGDTGASVTAITLPVTIQHSHVLSSHHGYVKNLTFARACAYKINNIYNNKYIYNIYSLSPFPSLSLSEKLDQTSKNERENFSQKMLMIFSQIVLNGQALALYPGRAQKLQLVLQEQLDGKLEHWQKVCQNIIRSKFLMGESKSSDFKVTLDWLLEGHNATKVLEGAYGVGDREVACDQMPSSQNINIQDIEILDEPQAMKELRLWFLDWFGVLDYISWFQETLFDEFNEQTFKIITKDSFRQEQIRCRFGHQIRQFLEEKYHRRVIFDICLKPKEPIPTSSLIP